MKADKRQLHKGFTLVEAIVTVTILAILAAAAVPGIVNYITLAQQRARNETARTVFMAAQSALTNRYGNGQTQPAEGSVALQDIAPALPQQEIDQNSDNIGFLRLDQGQGAAGQALYDLLEPYIADKTVLNQSILIEFNVLNGNMLSAFYSDTSAPLGYAGAGYNVTDRTQDNLAANRTGYYGVDGTGKASAVEQIGDVEIALVDYTGQAAGHNINGGANYGILTLECLLPQNRGADFAYDITLKPANGMEESLHIVEKEGADSGLSLEAIGTNLTLEYALQNPFEVTRADGTVRHVAAYLTEEGDRELLVVVLDAVYPGMSIAENYPNIQPGALTASLTVSSGAQSKSANAGMVHAYYADETQTGDTVTYGVASVRHLHNIRYKAAAGFVQRQDIAMTDHAGRPLLWQPIGDAAGQSDTGFKGSYSGSDEAGNAYALQDLTVDGERAGLFDGLSQTAQVKDIALTYTEGYLERFDAADETARQAYFINGEKLAGGIAAYNAGRIEHCMVDGRVTSGASDGQAGGIAGQNDGGSITLSVNGADVSAGKLAGGIAAGNLGQGRVESCTALCDVQAHESEGYAGGIVGANEQRAAVLKCMAAANVQAGKAAGGVAASSQGELRYCEVGTASGLQEGAPAIVGTPYFGAYADGSQSDYKPDRGTVQNNIFTISATGKGARAGGIAGEMAGGSLYYCVNASKVEAADAGDAGGLVGVTGEGGGLGVRSSYNAGDVAGGATAGGLVGSHSSKIEDCYNTGLVNVRTKLSTEYGFSAYVVDEALHPEALSGGLAGINHGSIARAYNAQYVGDAFGGAVGLNLADMEGCAFLQNMHNRTALCRTQIDGEPKQLTGVEMLDAKTLRQSRMGQLLPNAQGNGVGAYEYPYPYLNVKDSDCALAAGFHRTPYQMVLEDVARVRIAEKEGGLLEVRFMFREKAADLVLHTDQGDVIFAIDETTRRKAEQFSAIDYGQGLHATMGWYGNLAGDTDYAYCDGAAMRLNAESPDYADGYRYEFVLWISWPKGGGQDNQYLPEKAASCTAKLYPYGKGGGQDELPWAQSQEVTTTYEGQQPDDLVTSEQSRERTTAIHFWLPEGQIDEVLKIELTFLFQNGEETFSIKPEMLRQPYRTDGVGQAIQAWNGGRGPVDSIAGGGSHQYPFYEQAPSANSGYREYVAVLLWDEAGNQGWNGLSGLGKPFQVKLSYTLADGSGFEYLSPPYEGVQK